MFTSVYLKGICLRASENCFSISTWTFHTQWMSVLRAVHQLELQRQNGIEKCIEISKKNYFSENVVVAIAFLDVSYET